MAVIQAKYFVLSNGNRPTNCSIDDSTKIRAEIIINSEYPVDEEIDMLQLTIVNASSYCIKKFLWQGACSLKRGTTYTIDTPIFGPIPIGSYHILTGQSGMPLSRTIGECHINLAEVSC